MSHREPDDAADAVDLIEGPPEAAPLDRWSALVEADLEDQLHPAGPTEDQSFDPSPRYVIGARCDYCGVATWKVSLSGGRIPLDAIHKGACPEPMGRFDREALIDDE